MKRVSPSFPGLRWRSRARPPTWLHWVVGCATALALLPTVTAAAPSPSPGEARPRAGFRPGGSYLSTLGPVPLRVRRTKAPSSVLVMPPLAMRDPVPPPESATTNAPPGPPPSPPPEERLPEVGPPLAGSPGSLLVDPQAEGRAPTPIYTPQMLVQFFKPAGSNRVAGAWSVPVFLPPSLPPGPTRSSSATYISQ